jgi:hypothetical protein
MNIRPRQGDGPPYSPQRDLAYIYAPAMKEALLALDQTNWGPEIRQLCQQLELSEDDIGQAAAALAQAQRYFVNHDDCPDAHAALTQAGWYDCKPGARYLVTGRLGEVIIGGFCLALRDVSVYAAESAQHRELSEVVAAGLSVLHATTGQPPPLLGDTRGAYNSFRDRADILGVQDALRQAQGRIATLEHEKREANAKFSKELQETTNQLAGWLREAAHMGFFRSVWWVFAKRQTRFLWLLSVSGLTDPKTS